MWTLCTCMQVSTEARGKWSLPGVCNQWYQCGCWESNWVTLEEQSMPLTIKPSFKPLISCFLKNRKLCWAMIVHIFNISTWEVGKSLSWRPIWSTGHVPGQPELQRETLRKKLCTNYTVPGCKYTVWMEILLGLLWYAHFVLLSVTCLPTASGEPAGVVTVVLSD